MPGKQVKILSTRPLPLLLVEKAAADNIILETDSFIRTMAVTDYDNLAELKILAEQEIIAVFTSMNAAESVAEGLKEIQPVWKIFGLGTTTRNILEKHFKKSEILGGAENAAALADVIIANGNIQSVIFFCGDRRRDELPEKLQRNQISVREVIVYKTIFQPHKIENKYDGILFFSPSAVESFFVHNRVAAETVLFAIGNTTAQTLEQYSTNKVITSDDPGKEDLVNKAMNYFNTINEHQ